MARRGFFGRIADAVRSIVPGRKEKPEPPPERKRPSGKDIIDIVEPPPRPPGPGRGGIPVFGKPSYHASSDTWTGNGAPTARQWGRIKEIAENNISDPYANFVYHTSVVSSRATGKHINRKGVQTLDIPADLLGYTEPRRRYADIIKAMRTGQITPDEMIQRLREQSRAWDSYATSNDSGRGRASWYGRNPDLPDSLYYYH